MRRFSKTRTRSQGSALLEFAIVLPLLVLFLVGIYDFSGALNQKQKISHAAQEGAVVAGAQPMTDMDPTNNPDPDSLHPVLEVVLSSLEGSNVLPPLTLNSCMINPLYISGLRWTYTISNCIPDTLTIAIDRGLVDPGSPASVRTSVTVSYPYHWQFNGVIQMGPPTDVSETASVQNQL